MNEVRETQNFTSLNEMLEQIKNIMSDDNNETTPLENTQDFKKVDNLNLNHVNTEMDGVLDGILELSHSSLLDDVPKKEEEIEHSNDVFTSIDNIINESNNTQITPNNEEENSQQSIDDLFKNEQPKEEPLPISTPEPVIETSESDNLNDLQEPEEESEANKLPTTEEIIENEKSDTTNTKTLISEETAQETSTVLKDFIKTTEKHNTHDELSFRNGTSLEAIVIEAIKPELSKWLNDNLANIVKSVVEKEVKKLIPREED